MPKPEVMEIHQDTVVAVPMDDMIDTLETLRAAKAEIKKWKDVEDAAKEKINERLDEAGVDAGAVNGTVAIVRNTIESRRVDLDKLRETIPADLLDDYFKTSVSVRLELK